MSDSCRCHVVVLIIAAFLCLAGCQTGESGTALKPDAPPRDDDLSQSVNAESSVSSTIQNGAQPADGGVDPSETGKTRVAVPFPGVRVSVNGKRVELDGVVCIDAGWLEFIACSPNTKEHESLVVLEQQPSDIHAALLLAGFDAGSPGWWTYDNERFELVPPTGSRLQIDIQYSTPDGKLHQHSVCQWILDHLGHNEFPCADWIFGGSDFQANHPDVGGEHYVADMTGSIIGLATFGDEMIGYSEVIAHDSSVQAPEWEAHTRRLPRIGTPVTVIIRSAD